MRILWAGMVAVVAVGCGGKVEQAPPVVPVVPEIAPPQVVLAVSVSGDGVVRGPGMECRSTCTQRLPKGTRISLTAAPDAGATFGVWSGACSGQACDLTLDADTSVNAQFKRPPPPPAQHQLTVLVDGHGSVRSVPQGIDCGTNCTALFNHSTGVLLTATPDAGFRFVGWSGACVGTAVCPVAMTADMPVSARFEALPPRSVQLSVAVTGPGSVRSTPAGIDCGPLCRGSVTSGTAVALVSAPVAGARFLGWSGACSGTAPLCNLAPTADAQVSANFEMEVVELSQGHFNTSTLALNSSLVLWNDWVNSGWAIRAMPKASGAAHLIAVTQNPAISIVADDQSVYYVASDSWGHGGVYRAPVEGGAPVWLAEASTNSQIAMDDTFLYFAQQPIQGGSHSGLVVKIDKRGGPATTIASNLTPGGPIAVDATHVWFTDQQPAGGSSLDRVPKIGGRVDGFIGCSCSYMALKVDAANYYLRDVFGSVIVGAKVPGAPSRTLPGQNGDGYTADLDVNAGVVYWNANYYYGQTWQLPNGIWRANADGTEQRQLDSGPNAMWRAVRVDDVHVFYIQQGSLMRRLK